MYKYLVLFIVLTFSCKKNTQNVVDPYTALSIDEKSEVKNVLLGLEAAPDLEVQLFAHEPMFTNPTNMDVDAKGRVWICESYNYRTNVHAENPYRKTGDRIVILEDQNADGKADTSKVFYQGEDINAALGIAVLGHQVIVSCSPNVYVFTDLNGDDKADKKEILFTGIGGNQNDHGLHAVSVGVDGKLYFNMGNFGAQVLDKNRKPLKDRKGRLVKTEGKPFREGMTLRCNIDGSDIEVMAYNFRNPYEVCTDSFLGMWQSDNDDDGNKGTRVNYLMEGGNYGYKDEMTGADWKQRRTNMEDSIPLRHWHQYDPGVSPNFLQTLAGSPGGITMYEGDLLPAQYKGTLIHAESYEKMIRSYKITPKGAGFDGEINYLFRAKGGNEWFRPSDVCVAPDGSIMVADWADTIVGGHNVNDLKKGRIYRIVPKGHKKYEVPLYDATKPALALKNPNIAFRYLAMKDMVAKKDFAQTRQLLNNGSDIEKGRALGVLLQNPTERNFAIKTVIDSKNQILQIALIRIMRSLNIQSIPFDELFKMNSMAINRELALSCANAAQFQQLAQKYQSPDKWYLEALGIAADGHWDEYLLPMVKPQWQQNANMRDLVWRSRSSKSFDLIVQMIQNGPKSELARNFRATDFVNASRKNEAFEALIFNKDTQIQQLALKHIGAAYVSKKPELRAKIEDWASKTDDILTYLDLTSKFQLQNQAGRLQRLCINHSDDKIRSEAGSLLVQFGKYTEIKRLLLDPKTQTKALATFGSKDYQELFSTFAQIVKNEQLSLEARNAAIIALHSFNGDAWSIKKLVPALDEPFKSEAIKWVSYSSNEQAQKQAKKLISEGKTTIVEANKTVVLNATGKVTEGRKVFEIYCKTCHKIGNTGTNFGPNLGEIANKMGKDGLFSSIQYPNFGISFGFETHEITLKNGQVYRCIVQSKTENEMEIKLPGSEQVTTLKRADVRSDKVLEESLMPQMGLQEKDLIDLLEFLQTLHKTS